MKVARSTVVTSVVGKRGDVEIMEWMKDVTAGPARAGRVEAMMSAIFLDAMLRGC